MNRVAVYARVSTKDQSTEVQVAQLTAYCQARGWTDVVVFRDDGISGVRDNRPELDKLRARMLWGSSRRSWSRRWIAWVARSG